MGNVLKKSRHQKKKYLIALEDETLIETALCNKEMREFIMTDRDLCDKYFVAAKRKQYRERRWDSKMDNTALSPYVLLMHACLERLNEDETED